MIVVSVRAGSGKGKRIRLARANTSRAIIVPHASVFQM